MFYLGIDPGASGAIAVVSDEEDRKVVLSNKLGNMTPQQVCEFFEQFPPNDSFAVIEFVQAFPLEGRSSVFKFGYSAGLLTGAVAAQRIPLATVTPKVWQVAYCDRRARDETKVEHKEKLFDAAKILYPQSKFPKYKADAVLLANYCRRNVGKLF